MPGKILFKFQTRANETVMALIFAKCDNRKWEEGDSPLAASAGSDVLSASRAQPGLRCPRYQLAAFRDLPPRPSFPAKLPTAPKVSLVFLVASESQMNHFLKIQFPTSTGLRKNLHFKWYTSHTKRLGFFVQWFGLCSYHVNSCFISGQSRWEKWSGTQGRFVASKTLLAMLCKSWQRAADGL